jgi:hypothetical protein
MDQDELLTFRGLSENEEELCRSILQRFEKEHGLARWALMITKREMIPGRYHIRIAIAPPPEFQLPTNSLKDIAGADATFNIAAEVGKMLEIAYRTHFR